MSEVTLAGLDGSNPLAFLAALGTLRILDDRARNNGESAPRLSWRDEGAWHPVIRGPAHLADIVTAVLEDRDTWAGEPALEFAYTIDGEPVDPGAKGAIRDLKPPLPAMRALLDRAAKAASRGDRRSARQVAAYATDVATDRKGNTKPTALHFTAGQQAFLDAVAGLHETLTEAEVREALAGPWRRDSPKKSLGWDPMGAFGARLYALRASDPSKEKRPCVPGAEWLAFVGLSFLPTVPSGRRVATTCVHGGWKDAVFLWPLWALPATARATESLLRTPGLAEMPSRARGARGIVAVLAADILRSDQGGYGSFSPTRVC